MAKDDFPFLVSELESFESETADKDPDLVTHSKAFGFIRQKREVSVSAEQLEGFWKDKVVGMTETLARAEAEKGTKGFRVDEITFSLGVGAKGGIAFVAEGSVEASIAVTLRRPS